MTTLIIVESPGKIKKIGGILGSGYRVMASIGHIRDLPRNGALGFSFPEFVPEYEEIPDKKTTIAALCAAAKEADQILLASDPDREGEAIAWHIAETLRLKDANRITFTAITDDKVKAAVKNPRKINYDLVHSQETRRVLDRMIGWQVSDALRRKVGGLTAGRVQTVAVRLVFDRENAIKNFKAIDHFSVDLIMDDWKAGLDLKSVLKDGETYLIDVEIAKRIATIRDVTVISFSEQDKPREPAAPFTTSTLQIEAGKKLGFSPKKTMELAQKLYEQGAITYHRTDAPNLDPDGEEDIKGYLRSKDLAIAEKSRKWKAKDGAQEGHEAIRPAHAIDEEIGQTDDEKALYRLIWCRAVASQMANAIYSVRQIILEGQLDGRKYHFKASGRTLIKDGWLSIYSPAANEDEDNEENIKVPVLQEGTALVAQDGVVVAKKTQPPRRFKEETLVAEMERRGVGRPSTYASIIEKIFAYHYIEKSKNFLVPTAMAVTLCEAVSGSFMFSEYDYTKALEDKLDDVAEGKADYLSVVSAEWNTLEGELSKLEDRKIEAINPCSNCGKPMNRRKGANGFFWGCSGYPDCKTTLPDEKGKPGQKKVVPVSEFNCKACDKPLIRRIGKSKKNNKNYDFFACSGFPSCKTSYETKNNEPDYERSF